MLRAGCRLVFYITSWIALTFGLYVLLTEPFATSPRSLSNVDLDRGSSLESFVKPGTASSEKIHQPRIAKPHADFAIIFSEFKARVELKVEPSKSAENKLSSLSAPKRHHSADAVISSQMANLERLAEAANRRSLITNRTDDTDFQNFQHAKRQGGTAGSESNDVSSSLPIPIEFVFDEANFTGAGRKAALLLLKYLKAKGFETVSLTGHADERGSAGYNMALSQKRLNTIDQFLRQGGYDGGLVLIPKGETQPFTEVDRSQYSQEDLYQLDRRVELLVSQ